MSRRPSVTREAYGSAVVRDRTRTLSPIIGTREPPRRRHRHGQTGASLVGLLAVLVILGGIGAIAALSVQKATPTLPTLPTTPTTGQDTTTTSGGSTIPLAALRAACVANVEAVITAAQEYAIANAGATPPGGAGWATAGAHGGPYLQAWPVSAAYAIAWNGRTVVVHARHGRVAVGSAGTSSPPTGCYGV